ncbi:MAG: ATP-binding protein [Chloroflexota bacterium]
MTLLDQTIQLLSGSPGNILYHLVTLFSLQIIFALSLMQWRRDKTDQLMRRSLWASGIIFLGRLGLLLAGLAVANNPATAVSVLPPLEQALNTATALLIVWALIPQPDSLRYLSDTLVIIALLVIGVMYIFFAQTWPDMALSGTPYNETTQAAVWTTSQLMILVLGVVLTSTNRALWLSLRQIIPLVLLAAYAIHLFSNPDLISTQTDIAAWIRLGYLVAFPLWAVFIYRHSLSSLLAAAPAHLHAEHSTAALIDLSTQVISSLQTPENINNAIQMVERLLPAPYIGLAVRPENARGQLLVTSNRHVRAQDSRPNWQINLDEWPAFQQALMENLIIELTPDGLGARQLRLWYEEMGIAPQGPLLIEPLFAEKTAVGLLLLGGKRGETGWSDSHKTVAASLAAYFAQVLHNSHAFNHAADQIAVSPTIAETQHISGRLITLEDERDGLQTQLDTASARLLQAETQAAKSTKQARDLAATLAELNQLNQDERVAKLEKEIETLRESLIEAEEAMALAAAGERGLSTEWIMTALTRYSSQLEAAQAHIQNMEAELMRRERGVTDELVVSLAQELRTPMTSIAGYTDLLLSEMIGVLGEKQRDFLQRVKANVERMDAFLDLIVQLTTAGEATDSNSKDQIDVQTVLETAVTTVITQIREKNLHLDLNIQPDLPALTINREALQQILNTLMGNACQASRQNSRVAIYASTSQINPPAHNGHHEPLTFMHLAVTDSGGGISIDDRSRVFDPQHRADHALIDGLGDTGAGLAITRTLTEANGGRVWIESDMGVGSTLSILFPVAPEAANGSASHE